ncbi:major facilitator superfamily domain-containing protein [Xylogone sp. PMI_703]|nr:major facilitator superfamily domain-containing protein [Xylogone sp. PMI_703]
MRSLSNASREREPLLASSSQSLVSETELPTKHRWLSFTTISPRYRWLPFVGCAIIFLNEAEYFIKQVATMRAIEAMYCYEYYAARGSPLIEMGKHIPERLCKDPSIQKELAKTSGLIMFVRMFSAMIGAVPLGWAADRIGRKPVVVVHKINVTITCVSWLVLYLSFPKVPIWTLYLSGLPGIFGGNFDVGLAMLFASYTDVIPSASERASLFFLTTSMQYCAQIFCPSIGAWLMNLDGKGGTPEVNLIVSLSLATTTALIAIFAFPETLHESRKLKGALEENSESSIDTPLPPSQSTTEAPSGWGRKIIRSITEMASGVNVINIAILSLSISFAATGIKAIDWYALVQYPVIKLGWTFPQASQVVSMQGFLMLVHFSIVLPFLNHVAVSKLGSPGSAHFVIMVGSCLLLTFGSLLIGFSNTGPTFISGVVVYLFGEGLPTATQAYIVSLVEKASVARVMATLSMASIFGKLGASLLFPKLLALGVDSHSNIWLGLPLYFSAGLFVASALCVSIVGLRIRLERKDTAE